MRKNSVQKLTTIWFLAILGASACAQTMEPRQMENLGRGVIAIKQNDGRVFVGWRMLGTDPDNIAFNLYRKTGNKSIRVNDKPLTGPTNFLDSAADAVQSNAYFVRPIMNGKEQAASAEFTLAANVSARPYLSVPLQAPETVKTADGQESPYTANDASVADLDGDGEYEIVVHMVARGADNSHFGPTDPPILQAYKLNGKLLWTINLGRNIRDGAHYTQFMVYDLEGDGRAELVCKTADGTEDGTGKVIGDPNANYVNQGGFILSGPEYLTVFDGLTGKALATEKYIPRRHPDTENPTEAQLKAAWGDGYGNRVDRFLACIAYLDGVHPSVVMSRGYYTRISMAAWDFRGGKLTNRWTFDTLTPGNEKYAGQGNHNLSVADVDDDGKDEVTLGSMTVDDNGKGLFTTGLNHGDAQHLSDLDPERPGLEIFAIHEHPNHPYGITFRDARTGEVIWGKPEGLPPGAHGPDVGRGVAFDIDPRSPGFECWSVGPGISGNLFSSKGKVIAQDVRLPVNMGIYWDGDLLSELLDGTVISKWDYVNSKLDTVLDVKTFDCVSNNGTKANPCLSADILGDWREEVIYRTADNKELRIFSSTIPTEYRLRTFMHDPVYRLGIAWQNVGYNQPPHLGFYLDPEKKAFLRPNMVTAAAR